MKKRFKLGLPLSFGLMILATEAAVLLVLSHFFIQSFNTEVDDRLADTIAKPGRLLAQGALPADSFGQRDTMESLVGPALDEALIFSAEGVVLVSLRPQLAGFTVREVVPLAADWAVHASQGGFTGANTVGDQSFQFRVSPVVIAAGQTPALFSYVRIRTTETERERARLRNIILGGAFAAFAGTTVALLIAGHFLVTRRLQKIASAVGQVTDGNYGVRIFPGGPPDEITFLSQGFNTMSERLSETVGRMQSAIREAEQAETKYRVLFEHASEAIMVAQGGIFVFANPRASQMFGPLAGAVVGMSIMEIVHPDDRALVAERHALRLRGETPPSLYEFRAIVSGNREITVELSTVRIDWEGRPATLNFIADISERKRGEADLVGREQRARRQRAALAELFLDPRLSGSDRAGALELIIETASNGLDTCRASYWQFSPDRVLLRCHALRDSRQPSPGPGLELAMKDYPRYFAALRTERLLAADAARTDPRTSEFTERYLVPLGIVSMLDVVVQTDSQPIGVLCVEHVGAARQWQLDEQSFIATLAAVAAQMIAQAERRTAENENKRLQEELSHALKMESVGRLAGGVAHDFNNMLQAIIGNVDMALEATPMGHPNHQLLVEVMDSARRSAALTRQLLAFARKQTVVPKVVRLDEVVAGLLAMLRRLIGENIELDVRAHAGLWNVLVDPGQVDQILANLCVNARDAISGTGRISIEIQNAPVDAETAGQYAGCSPGDYVQLTVADTGAGMDSETLAHIFEPFFTTKEAGKGTGLGLAMVFGIVKQNGGSIRVRSRLGEGSRFSILFPRCTTALPEAPVPLKHRDFTGSETILIVEDEPQVRDLGQRMLSRQGYTVLAAESPAAAIQLVARHSGPIDLLITDVIMPGMNGRELRERLAATRPGLKCLFMSGYTADIVGRQGLADHEVNFLQKPFSKDDLGAKVREVLGRR